MELVFVLLVIVTLVLIVAAVFLYRSNAVTPEELERAKSDVKGVFGRVVARVKGLFAGRD
jgi:hypothetical protein